MRLFLNGGVVGQQTKDAIRKFNLILDHTKPILYIPLAMKKEKYDSCYEWITSELKSLDIPYIEMVRSFDELANKDFTKHSALFIGGGNTFKLLAV